MDQVLALSKEGRISCGSLAGATGAHLVREVAHDHNREMSTVPTLTRRRLDLAGLDIPALEITGTADGPRLTVLAGVHGCEYAPMGRSRARSVTDRELRGRVLAIGQPLRSAGLPAAALT